jgi:hypothetical protein
VKHVDLSIEHFDLSIEHFDLSMKHFDLCLEYFESHAKVLDTFDKARYIILILILKERYNGRQALLRFYRIRNAYME